MSSPVLIKPVDSPCVGICALDEEDLCLGCRRHISEIAAWTRFSTEQRRHILMQLPTRTLPKE